MFFKLQKYSIIFTKLFLTESEMQILPETQIPRDLTLRLMYYVNQKIRTVNIIQSVTSTVLSCPLPAFPYPSPPNPPQNGSL